MLFTGVIGFLFGYVLCAAEDLFFRRVPNIYVLFLAYSGAFYVLSNGISYNSFISAFMLLFITVIFSDKITRFIGGADVKIILVTVITLGIVKTLKALAVAIISAGLFAFVYLIVKTLVLKNKADKIKAETVPFVPFLLIGVITLFF